MSDLQAIADRLEIEALRGEHADALNMGDYDHFASLFTNDAVWRMPDVNLEFVGREEIRTECQRLGDDWEYFVQNTHPGVIQLEGDTASGRDYIYEIGRQRDGRSVVNYALFHDRYQRTPDGWKFAERVYEVKYLDTTPLAGSPHVNWDDANPAVGNSA
jgi:ketosteroid isomerase-like protein